MNSPVQSGTLGSWRQRYPIVATYATGLPIPGYAVMQVAGASVVGSDATFAVIIPNGSAAAKYIINSPGPISPGAPGAATDQYPTDALIAGTPAINQEIGPTVGSWSLSVSGKGFLYLGGLAGGIGRVASKAGTAAPGDDYPLVRIVNDSGLPKAFGNIVGYGPPTDPPPGTLYRIPTFLSAAPAAGQPFAVLLSDVAYNDTCDAGPVGVVACQINLTDATHGYADVVAGDYGKLASAASGAARIIWRAKQGDQGAGTLGLQWARVLLGPPATTDDIRGFAYATIPAATGNKDQPVTPGVGLVKLHTMPTGPAGTPWPVATSPVTAENWMRGTVAVYKPLLLRPSRKAADGSQIYTIIAEGCAEVPSG